MWHGSISHFLTKIERSTPTWNFFRYITSYEITGTDALRECSLNLDELQKRVADFHPVVEVTLEPNSALSQIYAREGRFPNFSSAPWACTLWWLLRSWESLLPHAWPRKGWLATKDCIFKEGNQCNGDMNDIHVPHSNSAPIQTWIRRPPYCMASPPGWYNHTAPSQVSHLAGWTHVVGRQEQPAEIQRQLRPL